MFPRIQQMEKDYDRYGVYYHIFFSVGVACQVLFWIVFQLIISKRYQRVNPIGIMFNLLIVQFFNSLRHVVAGILFLIYGFDWISIQIDGVTDTDFNCSFEGLYYYAFYISEVVWGIVWIFDYILISKKPTVFTGKYLMYYCVGTYFFSFGFSIVLYYQTVNNFTSATNIFCFVVDDNPLGYYLMMNIPIVLYIIAFFYFFFAYALKLTPPPQVSNDQEENLMSSKPEQSKSVQAQIIYYKLHQSAVLIIVYFFLWIISVVPNFFYPFGGDYFFVYSITTVAHPFITMLIIGIGFIMGAQNYERGHLQWGAKKKNPNADLDTEMSEQSAEGDDIANALHEKVLEDLSKQGTALVHYREADGTKQKQSLDQDLSQQIIVKKGQLSEFKDVVKLFVIPYVVQGFQKAFNESIKSRNLYEQGLKNDNEQLQQFIKASSQTPRVVANTPKTTWLSKIWKEFRSMNAPQIAADNEIENQILGHPEIMRRFNVSMKYDDLDKQIKLEKVTSVTFEDNANSTQIFDFVELAPELFRNLRAIQNVDDAMIKKLFSPESMSTLEVIVSDNKGGTFVIKPKEGGLFLRSMNKAEYKEVQNFLPEYYKYALMNPSTHLAPMLGVYTAQMTITGKKMPVYFRLMRNIQNFDYENLDAGDRAFAFEVKGSYAQKVLENPKDLLNLDINHMSLPAYKETLRDQDFLQSFKKLELMQGQSEKIMAQMENDVELLNKNLFMDYALQIIIVLKPYRHIQFITKQPSLLHGESAYKKREERKNEAYDTQGSIPHFNKEYQQQTIQSMSMDSDDMTQSFKQFTVIEGTTKVSKLGDAKHMYLKETTKDSTKTFHLCDPNDIEQIKSYEVERSIILGGSTMQKKQSLQNPTVDQRTFSQNPLGSIAGAHSATFHNLIEESPEQNFFGSHIEGSIRTKGTTNFPMGMEHQTEIQNEGAYAVVSGQATIVNIQKPELSYQFKKTDFKDQPKFLNQKKDPASGSFGVWNSAKKGLSDAEMVKVIDERLKKCQTCQKDKSNHLAKQKQTKPSGTLPSNVDVNSLTEREVIEQIVFDPQHGIVKREIHFGIIDYLTPYTVKKRLEEMSGGDISTVIKPTVYADRFMNTMKKIMQ